MSQMWTHPFAENFTRSVIRTGNSFNSASFEKTLGDIFFNFVQNKNKNISKMSFNTETFCDYEEEKKLIKGNWRPTISYPMLRMTHPSRNFFVLSLFCVYACLYG